MTAAAAMTTRPAGRGWTNHFRNDRLDQAAELKLDQAARAYFMASDSLRKERPYFTDSVAIVARKAGIRPKHRDTSNPREAVRRSVQRLEAKLETKGLGRRVKDKGVRIGFIPFATFAEIPVATAEDADRIEAEMRARHAARKAARGGAMTLPFPGLAPPLGCDKLVAGGATNLSAPDSPTESEKQLTTTNYAAEPESSSSFESPEPEDVPPAEVPVPAMAIEATQAPEVAPAPRIAPAAEIEEPWPGFVLAMAALLGTLGARMSRTDDRPIAGELADQVVAELVGMFGLRMAAWLIAEAARARALSRRGRGKAVEVGRWFTATGERWMRGDGWSPGDRRATSWPDELRPKPAAPPPVIEPPPEPPDRGENDARIRELEALPKPNAVERVELRQRLEVRAALDAAAGRGTP